MAQTRMKTTAALAAVFAAVALFRLCHRSPERRNSHVPYYAPHLGLLDLIPHSPDDDTPDYGCYDVVRNKTLRATLKDKKFSNLIKSTRANGYFAMSVFLETHPIVLDMPEHRCWYTRDITIFAPPDTAVAAVDGEVAPVLLRHIVGTRMGGDVEYSRTFLPGFVVKLTRREGEECDTINDAVSFKSTKFLYIDVTNRLYVYGLNRTLPPILIH